MTILEIEQNYQVEKIKVNGISFWPFLRNYLGYTLATKQDGQISLGKNNIIPILKSLAYGFHNFFKKADYIYSSSSDQKKWINGKYVDRMDYYIDALGTKNYLFIDQLNPLHKPKSQVKTKNISSKTWFYLFERIRSSFMKIEFEHEEIVKAILSDNNIELNHMILAKKMLSQYKISLLFFKWKKPKMFFITNAYTNCARVRAANSLGIKTVEFQHGIISKDHVAYTILKKIDPLFYPEHLLTFGENELSVFTKDNFYIKKHKVIPIGSFYIDYLNNTKKPIHPVVEQLRNKNMKIVSFSGQKPYNDISIPFIKKAALLNDQIAYLFMPRFLKEKDFNHFELPSNVFFIPELDTYEKILQSDIHSTLFSTTAVEALSIGKPNILINLDNLSKKFLKDVIIENEFTFLVNTPEEFVNKILELPNFDKNNIINSNSINFMPNFKRNVIKSIEIIEQN